MNKFFLLLGFIVLFPYMKTEISELPHSDLSVCDINEKAFTEGEFIKYKLYYNWGIIWLSAGEMTFSVKEDQGQLYLLTEGYTYPSYEWLFEVNNRYESWLDPETLLPLRSVRSIQEGDYSLYDEVEYHRAAGVAVSHRAKKKGQPLKKIEYEIDDCAHDLLSILYSARCVPFDLERHQKGTEIPIPLFFDKKEYDLSLIYRDHQANKKIKDLGHFDVLRFSPYLPDSDYFKGGDEMEIWVTNDKNKLPLYIESPLKVGKVKAILTEYDGLKYPLNAKNK